MPISPALFMPPAMQAIYAADPRVKAAQDQIKEGSSMAPANATQGIARALTALIGGYSLGHQNEQYQQQAQSYNEGAGKVFSQPDLAGMSKSASEEAKNNPLLAPLAQQLALTSAEKGPEIAEKQMQLRMMQALMGGDPNAAAATGAPPAPPAAPPAGMPGVMPQDAPNTISPPPPVAMGNIPPPNGVAGALAAPVGAPMPAAPPLAPPAPVAAPGIMATGPNAPMDIRALATDPQKAMLLGQILPKGMEAAQNAMKLNEAMHPGNAEMEKAQGKKAGEQIVANEDILSRGAQSLNALQELKKLNDVTPSGATAGAQAYISRNAEGVGLSNGDDAANLTKMKSLISQLQANDLKPLFGGTGQIRVAELNMLKDIVGLDPSMSKHERAAKIDMAVNMIGNQIKASQARTETSKVPGGVNQQMTLPPLSNNGLPPGLPDGSKFYGTSGGKKVYQLPDGSHVMDQ